MIIHYYSTVSITTLAGIKSSPEPLSSPPRIDKSTPLQHAHLPLVRPRASLLLSYCCSLDL